MAAVTLQRELDAYADAIDKYSRQARNYKTSAAKYNEKVDAYNAAFVKDTSGEIARFHRTRSGYMGVDGAAGMGFRSNDPNYVVVDFGGNAGVGLQYKNKAVPKPSEFNMPQPVKPGNAPTATAAQMKKLDQPSLSDIERNQSSGLIGSAFNF